MTRSRWTAPDDRLRRWLVVAVLAGTALLAVAGLTLYAVVRTVTATDAVERARHEQELFFAVGDAIALEYQVLQRYRLEPTPATQQQFADAAEAVTTALEEAEHSAAASTIAEARRLGAAQAAFRARAERLIGLVADGSPDAARFERSEVGPAMQALARTAETVTSAHTATAQRASAALSDAHTWLFTDAAVALALGLLLAVWGLLSRDHTAEDRATTDQDARGQLRDALTELPDQAMFAERLQAALNEAKHAAGRGLTVLMITLNGVPTIVRAHGAQALGQLLVAASRRLRRVIRDDDMVARIGEESFGVLLHEITDLDAIAAVTDRIEQSLGRLFRLKSGVASVRPNIGVAIGAPDDDPQEVVRRAETAMYRAASVGGGVALPDGSEDASRAVGGVRAEDRRRPDDARRTIPIDLSEDLRVLLRGAGPAGELTFGYQPMVRLTDATVVGVLASARWRHPHHGVLPATDFVPVAEEQGLATPLTGQLVIGATAQCARWRASGRPLVVTLEISSRCLTDAWFAPAVQSAIDRAGLDPQLLCLMVTESGVMREPQLTTPTLESIRRIGVGVAVTGCSPGASALGQLGRVPADRLVIDCESLDAAGSPRDQKLLREAVQTAHSLRLAACADGVADPVTLALLQRLGCEFATGPVIDVDTPAWGVTELEVPAACDRARQRAWETLVGAYEETG